MDNIIRFAVVGTEGIGGSHIKGIHNTPEAVLTAVCDINEQYAAKAASQNGLDRYFTDYDEMLEAVGLIERDITEFEHNNKWSDYTEIPALFKNLDIIRMQEAVAAAILYTAEHFGSRGSGFVLDGTAFMDRTPIPEDISGRGQVVTVRKQGDIEIECVDVKPIPDRELWFEKVWNRFNEIRK